MSTVSVTPSKRKIIDLKDDTFKTLSIMAIQKGTNLKNYIEDILNGIAEDYEDAKLYAKLRKEQPKVFKISLTARNLLGIVIYIEFV